MLQVTKYVQGAACEVAILQLQRGAQSVKRVRAPGTELTLIQHGKSEAPFGFRDRAGVAGGLGQRACPIEQRDSALIRAGEVPLSLDDGERKAAERQRFKDGLLAGRRELDQLGVDPFGGGEIADQLAAATKAEVEALELGGRRCPDQSLRLFE